MYNNPPRTGQPMTGQQMPPSVALYPTGIRSLDAILGGGLAQGCNVLVHGDPLCGKKPLLMQFLYEGLLMNVPGAFVLTDYGYEDWKRMMGTSGWALGNFEQSGLLEIVDCYSKQYDPNLQDAGFMHYADSPSALSSISLKLGSAQEKLASFSPMHRIAFHSISTIMEDAGEQTAFSFMQFITGKARHQGATAMYAIEKGMHERKDVAMIEHLMDAVIEFEENRVCVRGPMSASKGWHGFEVTPQGIIIGR